MITWACHKDSFRNVLCPWVRVYVRWVPVLINSRPLRIVQLVPNKPSYADKVDYLTDCHHKHGLELNMPIKLKQKHAYNNHYRKDCQRIKESPIRLLVLYILFSLFVHPHKHLVDSHYTLLRSYLPLVTSLKHIPVNIIRIG